jgi:Zn-dependent M28 family amino/carboxypeptidase
VTQAPTSTATQAAADFARAIGQRVTADAMMVHLVKLQQIAYANGGNRAVGTSGYDASVDYVADALRAKGFDVQIPEFELRFPFADPPALMVGESKIEAKPLEYTVGTPPEGVTGPLVAAPVDDSPGCTASDYDGMAVAGAVVLVDRGRCPFGDKQLAAADRGAAALIVADNVDDDRSGATLGEQTHVTIPVVTISKADGARLRASLGTATIKMNAGVRVEKTRNVLAQTKTGSPRDVVMVGGHLDSVPAGPGIDDNGSGVAAVLETALQMGSSANYVQSLSADELKDIALYLNFDMLASPNPAYFTYDGDQSAARDPQLPAPRVPEGSAGIERTLVAYLKSTGKTAQDMSFDGRSDFDAFTRAGIPTGGLFSGAEAKMTAEQAALWGGTADQPYDPNYHQRTDTLDHINRAALTINGQGVAYAVALYAQDLGGRNGVPVRDNRTRHTVTKP